MHKDLTAESPAPADTVAPEATGAPEANAAAAPTEAAAPEAAEANEGTQPTAVYGQYYYDSYSGGSYEYEGHWREWFGQIADHIIRQFRPKTVLDAGCAKGFLVRALRERGVEAYGIDASEYAIASASDEIRDYVRVGSILEPLDRRYDLITCIEVIEHLQPEQLHQAVDVLCAATDRVLLSSTNEGGHLGEPSHFSMRPPEDWAALFAADDFVRNLAADVTWLTPWATLYERKPGLSLPEAVRDYERQFTRMTREISELRLTAVRLEAELDTSHGPATGGQSGELARLREQAADAATKVLRLRDLLIVRERELGHARGEIESLRDQLRSFEGLLGRYHDVINSTTWQLSWKVLTPLRKVQERRKASS